MTSTSELEARLVHELQEAAAGVHPPRDLPPGLVGPLRRGPRRRAVRRVRAAVAVAAAVVLVTALVRLDGEPERAPLGPADATDRIDDPVDLTMSSSPVPGSPLGARRYAAAAWTGDEVVVWGGSRGRESLASGSAYDPATGRWRDMAPAPITARQAHVAVWTGSEVVVAGGAPAGGGFESLLDAAAWDPATDSWRVLPGLPEGRLHAEAAWAGGRVVVGAGSGTRGPTSTLLVLDPAAGWTTVEMGRPVGSVAAAGERVVVTLRAHASGTEPGLTGVALVDPVTGEVEHLPAVRDAATGQNEVGAAVWTGERIVAAQLVSGTSSRSRLLTWAPGERRWTDAGPLRDETPSVDTVTFDAHLHHWYEGWLVVSAPLFGLAAGYAPSTRSTVALDRVDDQCGLGVAFAWTGDGFFAAGGQSCAGGPGNGEALDVVTRIDVAGDDEAGG